MRTSWGTSAGETGRSHRCEQHRCRGDHHGDGDAKFPGIPSGGARLQSRSQAQIPCHRFSPDRGTSVVNPSSRACLHDETARIHLVGETTTTLDSGPRCCRGDHHGLGGIGPAHHTFEHSGWHWDASWRRSSGGVVAQDARSPPCHDGAQPVLAQRGRRRSVRA